MRTAPRASPPTGPTSTNNIALVGGRLRLDWELVTGSQNCPGLTEYNFPAQQDFPCPPTPKKIDRWPSGRNCLVYLTRNYCTRANTVARIQVPSCIHHTSENPVFSLVSQTLSRCQNPCLHSPLSLAALPTCSQISNSLFFGSTAFSLLPALFPHQNSHHPDLSSLPSNPTTPPPPTYLPTTLLSLSFRPLPFVDSTLSPSLRFIWSLRKQSRACSHIFGRSESRLAFRPSYGFRSLRSPYSATHPARPFYTSSESSSDALLFLAFSSTVYPVFSRVQPFSHPITMSRNQL